MNENFKLKSDKNKESVWQQFSTENNGLYVVGKYHNLDSVEIVYLNHKIIFDCYIHYQVVRGASFETAFTRVRLEFRSPDELKFRLTSQGFIDKVGKLLGAQDIQIGDSAFDNKFMIKGNDEFKIRTILSNQNIKQILSLQKDIQIQILDKEGIFDEPIQKGYSMLYYISENVVDEIEQLNSLLKLYQALIDQLTKTGSMKPANVIR